MYCKNCGTEIQEEQEFCSYCLSTNPDFKGISTKENPKEIIINLENKTKKKTIIPYIPWLIVAFIILIMVMTTSSSLITDLLMILVLIFFMFLISLFLGMINPNLVMIWKTSEKRNRKNVLLYYGIGAIVLYVFIRGFAYFNLINDYNVSSTSSQSSANYTQQETIKVTAKELYNDYNANEVNADNNYKGRIAIVTGEVSNITSTGDEICISLLGNSITQFSCYFDNNQSNAIGKLQKGQTITLKGKIRGKSWNICIDDCVLQ